MRAQAGQQGIVEIGPGRGGHPDRHGRRGQLVVGHQDQGRVHRPHQLAGGGRRQGNGKSLGDRTGPLPAVVEHQRDRSPFPRRWSVARAATGATTGGWGQHLDHRRRHPTGRAGDGLGTKVGTQRDRERRPSPPPTACGPMRPDLGRGPSRHREPGRSTVPGRPAAGVGRSPTELRHWGPRRPTASRRPPRRSRRWPGRWPGGPGRRARRRSAG